LRFLHLPLSTLVLFTNLLTVTEQHVLQLVIKQIFRVSKSVHEQ
jgi:hypothetical protein